MAVHAHPDDESIGTAGTLARYADEGLHTALVCCTRGEEGEIHDPALDAGEARPRLGEIREGELRTAVAVLRIETLRVLPYRDSGMAGSAANVDPRGFVQADPLAAAALLARIIRDLRPQVVVTYDPGGGYGHPDHVMTHNVTTLAIARAARPDALDGGHAHGDAPWQVQKLYYPAMPLSRLAWVNARMQERGLAAPFDLRDQSHDLRQLAVPDERIGARVAVPGYLDRIRTAMSAHRTQLGQDDVLLSLPRDLAARLFGVESYIRAWSRVPVPDHEDDLFAGLRETEGQRA